MRKIFVRARLFGSWCSSSEEKFSNEMGTLFNHVRESPLSEIKVGDVLYGMLSLVQKYHVVIEGSPFQFCPPFWLRGNFSTLCVGTIVLEGIGKQLDPEINLMGRAVPFLLMDSDFYEAKELLSDLTPKARAEVTRAVSKEAWNSLKEKVLPTWRRQRLLVRLLTQIEAL